MLSALGVVLFWLLAWQVTAGGALVRRDGAALRAVRHAAAAHPGLDGAAHLLCRLGNVQVAVPVLLAAVCAAAWLRRRGGLPRWWLPPAAGALVMVLVPLVVSPVKSAVHRPPPGSAVPDPSGYGYFPSGHTATSAVAFGAAALLLLPLARGRRPRRVLLCGTAAVVLAVGAALVWCDYHWPVDVLASWCLALALLPWVAAAHLADAGPDAAAETGAGGDVNCASGSPG